MYIFKKILLILLLVFMIVFFICSGIPVGMIIAYWDELPSLKPLEYETQAWHYPTKVYSDFTQIETGTTFSNLLRRLERLEYIQVQDTPEMPGQYYLKQPEKSPDNEAVLYLRAVNYPRMKISERIISIQIAGDKITRMMESEQDFINEFILEPEVISEFYGSEGTDRELVSLSEIPDNVINAFLAIEDKRFYDHWGFDLYRIAGSMWWNIKYSWKYHRFQGASTITQQLAKDLFLTRQQILVRKIKEGLLAIKIERVYTKDEILERYLNRVNLGRYGAREVYGIAEAAKYYFNKGVGDLSISEAATLAAIPKDPPKYSPIRNPEKSKSRRQIVIRQMRKLDYIDEVQFKEAYETPLMTVSPQERSSNKEVMHFLEYVRNILAEKYEPGALYRSGLKVYTTLDISMQFAANSAVQKGLGILDKNLRYPPYDENKAKWYSGERKDVKKPDSFIQAGLISVDPATGYVKAMIGGRDFYVSQFNRAIHPHRQPGSAFKPFIYCAAFANELAKPTTIVVDEPWELPVPGGVWKPRNFYKTYYGQVTIRKMLTKSINIATAKFFHYTVGPDNVISLANSMGITSPLDPVPALALGSSAVSLLEITSAYGIWANQGIKAQPICIKYVLDMEDSILEENTPPVRRVLSKELAYQMAYLMQGVVEEGTGRNIRRFGFERPAAGKTGTTNDETDAWFIGYVPDLATGVWVGFDEFGKSCRHTGAYGALPIWYFFMDAVVDGPVKEFKAPENIVFKTIDADTGFLAKKQSDHAIQEAFIKGTEPTE